MIIDSVLTVVGGFLQVILAPLEVINIAVDFGASIPLFVSFLQVIIYLFPWQNILPVILLTMLILNFKLIISTITAVWNLIPFVR